MCAQILNFLNEISLWSKDLLICVGVYDICVGVYDICVYIIHTIFKLICIYIEFLVTQKLYIHICVCVCVCVRAQWLQLYLTLCDAIDCSQAT